MTFTESVSTCFANYAKFSGTASRPEYWWFFLFIFLVNAVLNMTSDVLGMLFALATGLPQLAVGTRRLHETDRSGWWQLLWLVPVVGWIVLWVMLAQEPRPNRYDSAVYA